MCYRVNSDNSGRATGVSYYGPDGSDNTIEAEIVILAPFIYDNTRLLLLSKTDKFPNGLANSSGQVGKHIMAHIGARVFAAFDDRYVNIYMGPSAQKHSLDDFNADNFDHKDLGFIRGAQISVGRGRPRRRPDRRRHEHEPAARHAALGRRLSRLLRQVLHAPRRDRRADREPALRRPDHRSRSERARRLGPAGAAHDLRLAAAERAGAHRVHAQEDRRDRPRDGRDAACGARRVGRGAPGAHHEGGTRMGSDPKTSVVNNYGQSWDIPNLFVIGSSTFPSMSGFNPTLTIQALAYMSADAIVTKYKKSPGALL